MINELETVVLIKDIDDHGLKKDDVGVIVHQYQDGQTYEVEFVFRADNATAAEESLHAALHQTRMRGEWFKLTDEQKSALISVSEFRNGYFVSGEELLKAETLLAI